MAGRTKDNPTLLGSPTELVQVFRALGGDYRERLERFNGRGGAPLDQAARKEWTARWKPEQDAIQRHPLVQLCQRTSDLTGIDISDLREATMRISREGLAGFKPDVSFLSEREDLLWILPKLHALDLDGSTDRIIQELLVKYSAHEAVATLIKQFPQLARRAKRTRTRSEPTPRLVVRQLVNQTVNQTFNMSDRRTLNVSNRRTSVVNIHNAPPGDGKMKPPKGPPRPRKTRFTERQKEVLETYSDCGRDAAAAGRKLGTSKQYVSEVVKKSHQKFKQGHGSRRSVEANQKLPANRDGVESVSEGRGASDKGTGRKLRVKRKF